MSKLNKKAVLRRLKKLNIRSLLIIVPIAAALFVLYTIFSSNLTNQLAINADKRLTTPGWQLAQSSLNNEKPDYGTKYSYYQLEEGQDLNWAAKHFSVKLAVLQKLNPGKAVLGTTIAIPPVEQPLTPFNPQLVSSSGITVSENDGVLYVKNSFVNKQVYMNIPSLMQILKPYNGISQLSPKTYLIEKPLFIEDNIRTDITSSTVNTLLLRSDPNYDITTLTFQNSEALLDGVNVTSYVSATKLPDTNYLDGRSFVRAYENSRMDVLNSHLSYLGMGLKQLKHPPTTASLKFVPFGGVYGVSWRISSGTYGKQIVTGWVENSSFEHNYIGSFTFGASGMMWQKNLFQSNKIYGLDPHDDSDNATIENNTFASNGKHGFIVSKRCDYNVIKNNVAVGNKLQGIMLHDNSDYNLVEDNTSDNNTDNYVALGSSFNTFLNNKSYNPRGSAFRINTGPGQGLISTNNYIQGNYISGGKKGVYLYAGNVNNTEISSNTFVGVANQLITRGANEVLYTSNTSNIVGYQVAKNNRVVFGVNTVGEPKSSSLSANSINFSKL